MLLFLGARVQIPPRCALPPFDKGIMANLTPASKARCLGVFPCGEGATGEQVASATAGHGQQAARGTQIFSSSRSHSVNCRMIPLLKGEARSAGGFLAATLVTADFLLEFFT